jgi:hypothetical protein
MSRCRDAGRLLGFRLPGKGRARRPGGGIVRSSIPAHEAITMRTTMLVATLGLWLGLTPVSLLLAQDEQVPEDVVVSVPGEAVAQAETKATAALAASGMKMQVSAVGFDIQPGSEAEQYLQGTARAGGGGYFTANDAGQLTTALGAAASGRTSLPGGAATGPDAVYLTKPTANEIVGPSIEVVGKAPPNALVVIYTIAYPYTTDEMPKLVPGTRQRATATGDFAFRIATPRVSFGETKVQVRYAIHVHVLKADGTKGPEAVVNVFSPQPTP